MAKHTEGPWKYDGENYIFAGDQMVAEIRGFGAGLPQDANAQLIAAAPQLLESLQELLLLIEEDFKKVANAAFVRGEVALPVAAVRRAYGVIAKAEGK